MTIKTVNTPNYNYVFNTSNGFFARWGATEKDDPDFSPIGPEILDIEVSEVCHQGCSMCYKSNISKGRNMSLHTFKSVLSKMPTILQVAFGIGDIDGNPDLWEMMRYCRSKGVVPNITINGHRLSDTALDNLSYLCGAVAVSNYEKDFCYSAVKQLTDRGMKQVNIHQLLSQETFEKAKELVEDFHTDYRLKNLNAIVFLSLKQKGRGETYHRLDDKVFEDFVISCLDKGIPFGFDSCTAPKFSNVINKYPQYDKLLTFVEPCESCLFSSYVNVEGEFFPCSFAEGFKSLPGISVPESNNFLTDVWFSDRSNLWREILLGNKRKCPIYNV